MKTNSTLAVLALTGMISAADAYKQMNRDWDDLLSDSSVFNDKSYQSDTPTGYNSLVDEVVEEHDLAIKTRK